MVAIVDDSEAAKKIKHFSTDSQEVKCMGIFQYYLVAFLIVLVHYASQRLLHLYEGVYEYSIALGEA